MKTICKNIAFSPSGNCILEKECICKKNELWLEEDEPSAAEQDPFLDWIDKEIEWADDKDTRENRKMEPNFSYSGMVQALEKSKEKYLSLHPTQLPKHNTND